MKPNTVEPGEILALVILGMLGMGTAVSAALGWTAAAVKWLIAHGVLVAARQQPLVVVPGTDGAGLDYARLAVAIGVAVLLLVAAGGMLARAVRRRRQQEGE